MALKDEMAKASIVSALYLVFTLPDAVDGTRTFYWGDAGFNVSSITGNPRVYPVITTWPALRNFLPTDGQDHNNEVEIEILGKAKCTPGPPNGSTKAYTVVDLARDRAFIDADCEIFQWNRVDQTQQSIWRGYCAGFGGWRLEEGGMVGTLTLSMRGGPTETTFLGDVVTRDAPAMGGATYPGAPSDSLAKMIGQGYNKLYNAIDPANDRGPNRSVFLGFGTRGIPGVVTDEQLDLGYGNVTFMQTRGQALSEARAGTSDDPQTDSTFWVYIPEANTYAMLDAADFSLLNDTSVLRISSKLEPSMFVAHRPAGIGAQMAAGLTATAWKVVDDDSSNYLVTDASNYKVAFNIPPLQIGGLEVVSVGCVADMLYVGGGSRSVEFGIWNDFNAGAAGWWGNAGKKETVASVTTTARFTYFTAAANRYIASGTGANVGNATTSEFSGGRFIGRDANQIETPLQFFWQVTSGSKDGVRLYAIGIYVKCRLHMDRVRRVSRRAAQSDPKSPYNNPIDWISKPFQRAWDAAQVTDVGITGERRFDFMYCGFGHNDVGTTYEASAAGQGIVRASAIAHHILATTTSEGINTTAGTLGNFVDARAESVAGEKRFGPVWTPDKPLNVKASLEDIQSRTAARFLKRRGKWQCLWDEMNPDSSRWHRSTSDPVLIHAERDVVGQIEIKKVDLGAIRNSVLLNYGHSYGTNRPVKSYSYAHEVSKTQQGHRPLDPVDAPWIVPEQIDLVPEAAKYHARYLASRNARPRLELVVPLSLAYYDLQEGHILGFYGSEMESIGWECPAYRNGRLDHAFISATDLTDYADNPAPKYAPASGSSYMIFMAQQMPIGMTHYATTPAGYTVVTNANNWWDGSSWNNFTNIARSDAGDVNAFFKVAGPLSLSWDPVSPWLWPKTRVTVGGTEFGPAYVWRHQYTTATAQGVGNDITRIPKGWGGYKFETIEITPKRGGLGDYQVMEAVLKETM